MKRQWSTDIGYGRTVVDQYRVLKDRGRLISGMKREWSTDIGYEKTVVHRYRI